ncbi:MAG: SGNH/GDSL hydrolase family protein [Planctomycetaceae bacterium]
MLRTCRNARRDWHVDLETLPSMQGFATTLACTIVRGPSGCFAGGLVVTAVVAWSSMPRCCEANEVLKLVDGDRVVLVGDTFIEREAQLGYVETALAASQPDASISFRNLGWSGDTVWAESRGAFDPPAEGYRRLVNQVRELHPTVAFVAYGRNESQRGPVGLSDFRRQLGVLCNDLRGAAADERPLRLVLVTPHPFLTSVASRRNEMLAPYADAIRSVAAEQRASLVDLFEAFDRSDSSEGPGMPGPRSSERLSDNGVHLTGAGYAMAARIFAQSCGFTPSGDFESRSAGVREHVVKKNTLFFHRWRPANETYIHLFRRHEQGNHALEIPRFDPLVADAERMAQAAIRTVMDTGP